MVTPEDSLVSPQRRSPIKPVLAAVTIIGLAAGAWWMFGRGKGQPEDPARVLIVGSTPEIAGYLERKGFDPDFLSFGAAVGEGQVFDPGLSGLPAILEYADQLGFGYVALSMAHGEHYELVYGAEPAPPGTTFMVLSVGDLGEHVSYGGVPVGVLHEHPLDEQIGLLLALFGQPEISKARTSQARNDLMIRFGSARTVADVEAFEQAQAKMQRQAAAWDALAEKESGPRSPIELAHPYERLLGWPLANGAILLGSAPAAWRSSDGLSTRFDNHEPVVELSVISPERPHERLPCPALPDRLALDGFALAASGDALLIPSNAYVADLWILKGDGCEFERQSEIRRLDRGALGQPHASGRTAATQGDRLSWADAKMRAYRSAQFPGIELRPDALRWVSDAIVVIPASLDFAAAAQDRQQRAIAAALEAGLPAPEPDPSTELPEPPEPIDALVFVRLPAREQTESIELAVVPLQALVPDDSLANLRAVFPIADPAPTVVAYVDSKAGLALIRAQLGASGPAWRDALAVDFDLAAAAAAGRIAVTTKLLATDISLEAHDLVVSPTGSHAAWAAPADDDPGQAISGKLEIFVRSLESPSAAAIRMTDNLRRDVAPMFAGADGSLLLFSSDYQVDDAPELESVRGLPIR